MFGDRRSPSWRRYLRFWRPDPAADLDDELRFHLQARYDEYIAAGITPDQARAEVQKRFGDVAAVREQCVEIDTQWQRRQAFTDVLSTVRADLRLAIRQLRRSPSLSIAAILCFALGIGANTSIFSIVDAVLFRPLPFPESDRLVVIGESLPRFGGNNYGTIGAAEYQDYQRLEGRVFERTAIYESTKLTVTDGETPPERIAGAKASATLFDVLRVGAARGRVFQPGDDALGSPDVAILSHAFWLRRFNGDPKVIGRSIRLNGVPTTIIGVMPAGFAFPLSSLGDAVADVFTPFRITPDMEQMRGNVYGTVLIARLANGVTLEHAKRGASEIARDLPRLHPEAYRNNETLADVFPLRDRAIGSAKRSLLVLFGAVGLVLLIACINVSSLLLARAATRQRELSVRRALGATRPRLLSQFLAESLVLAAIGGVLGVGVAVWGSRLIATSGPQSVLQGYDIAVDGRVLAFSMSVAVITAIAVSLLPAFQLSDAGIAQSLRDEGRSSSAGVARHRARRTLVVSEIALALIVATGAGLMVKSLVAARRINPGFDPSGLATFRLALLDYRYATPDQVVRFEQDLIDRLRTLPGVTAATAATGVPMGGEWQIAVSIEGRDMPTIPVVSNALVFPGYFETLRIPMRAGRAFTAADRRSSVPVAIINETAARQFFPNESPLGKRLKWGSPTSTSPWATIVGVSGTVKSAALDAPDVPAVYYAAAQADSLIVDRTMRGMSYLVRTNGDPQALFGAIRRVVSGMDPEMPVVALRSFEEVVSGSVAARRFNTMLLTAFAVLAVALAAVGIYGLMAYAVSQRSREIGIRLAIGASPSDVFTLVIGQATRLAAIGVAIGLAGAAALTRLLSALLFDVSPLDPLTFAAATVLLLAIAVVATYLPARKAARVDVQSVIRGD